MPAAKRSRAALIYGIQKAGGGSGYGNPENCSGSVVDDVSPGAWANAKGLPVWIVRPLDCRPLFRLF